MAHWNYKDGKIHYWPAKDRGDGWFEVDCGCSGGIQWGGEEPIECNTCSASGVIFWHKKSSVFAQYPGGPFQGKGELSKLELKGGTG